MALGHELAWSWGCFAGSVLRSLRRLWEGSAFALPREGLGLFASKACSGPIPLPLGFPEEDPL